jgi:hypothetical protein
MKKMFLFGFLLCLGFGITSCTQEIPPPKAPTGVRLISDKVTLKVGEQTVVSLAFTPEEAKTDGSKYSWNSSEHSKLATINTSASGNYITITATQAGVIYVQFMYDQTLKSEIKITITD